MGTVEVRLFGAPEILRDGAPVPVDTRKAIALLAVLAAERRPVRRDVLAGMLWPDASQGRSRASLRRTLSTLRSAIGDDALVADRETIALTAAGVEQVDVVEFESRVSSDPAAAVDLYRGPFLEGFSLADSVEFDDWQRDRSEEYRRRVDRLLADLGVGAEPERALELSLRRRALDPLNEDAARQAMRALAGVGDRSAAIAVYRELVARLEAELGVEPLQETTDVYERVRRGDRRGAPPSEVTSRPGRARVSVARRAEPVFVGRDEDLVALTSAVRSAGLVIVTGEPGIGRSRLLSEWARTLDSHLALRGHVGERSVPYAPLAPWLDDRPPGTAVALFEQIASSVPLEPGGVIVVDDLHLVDSATMAFLAYVVHRRDRFGWSVVGTWRGEGVAPGDACWDLLAEARREGWGSVHRLRRLGERDVLALIDVIGGVTPERALEIAARSEGVPLVAVELLGRPPDGNGLPPVVDDLMRDRLSDSTALARQIVEAMAVIGRPASAQLLHEVSGRTETETAEAIGELVALDIAIERGDEVWLGHQLLGVVALDAAPASRRRALHARAGRALPAAEAAGHLALAGRPEEAAECHLRAACEARAAHAPSAALHHLRAALALGGSDEAVVHREIGLVEATLGRYDAARRAYELSAARSTGVDLVELEILLARLALRCNDPPLASSHLDSAQAELAAAPPAASRRLRVDLAVCRALVESEGRDAAEGHDLADAHDAGAVAIELARAVDDPALEAEAFGAAALVAYRHGDVAGAAVRARRARRLAELGPAPLVDAAAANLLGLLHVSDGRADAAIPLFEQALAVVARHGDVHRLAAVHANLGDALHAAGDDRRARDHQLESVRLFSEVSGPPAEGRAGLWLLTAW